MLPGRGPPPKERWSLSYHGECRGIKPSAEAPVIGLLGQYSSQNLGDAAIVHEIIRNLRARFPGATFVGICSQPDDTVRTQGIAAFPISGHGAAYLPDGRAWASVDVLEGRGLLGALPTIGMGTRRIDRVVRSLSLLLMAGGGQIDEYWGGAYAQPRFLATWTLLAKFRRVPTVYFGVGLDQLATRMGRFLVLAALGHANLLSFRDHGTYELLQSLGLRKPGNVHADPAFGLAGVPRKEFVASGRVVISPICQRSWPGATDEKYARYLHELARYCEAVIRAGLTVRFACTQISVDPDAVAAVSAAIDPALRGSWSVAQGATFDEFVHEASAADLLVTSRLHGVILSVVAGTTVIAVSVARKVNAVMADIGLDDYCLEAATFDADELFALSLQALGRRVPLEQQLRERFNRIAATLPDAYDAVAALLGQYAAAERRDARR